MGCLIADNGGDGDKDCGVDISHDCPPSLPLSLRWPQLARSLSLFLSLPGTDFFPVTPLIHSWNGS